MTLTLAARVQTFLQRLQGRQLVVIFGILFVVDLFFPDPIPFLDEILLGILTMLAARWSEGRAEEPLEKEGEKNVTPGQE